MVVVLLISNCLRAYAKIIFLYKIILLANSKINSMICIIKYLPTKYRVGNNKKNQIYVAYSYWIRIPLFHWFRKMSYIISKRFSLSVFFDFFKILKMFLYAFSFVGKNNLDIQKAKRGFLIITDPQKYLPRVIGNYIKITIIVLRKKYDLFFNNHFFMPYIYKFFKIKNYYLM